MSELAARQIHFEEVVARLPSRLEQLTAAPAMPRKQHPRIPKGAAIYLFSERGNYLYVGQTRTLSRRLGQHTRPRATEGQASFAFAMTVDEARLDGLELAETRKKRAIQLEERFLDAKRRVAAINVQFIEVEDPIERSVFEIFAALHLETEQYNSFETH